MNFTVNKVRYRSHNGVFPVKRRFGADAVLVHIPSSTFDANNVAQSTNEMNLTQQQEQLIHHILSHKRKRSSNFTQQNHDAEHTIHVCAMDRRGFALIRDGGEYEVRSFQINEHASRTSSNASALASQTSSSVAHNTVTTTTSTSLNSSSLLSPAQTSFHKWVKRQSRKRTAMKLSSKSNSQVSDNQSQTRASQLAISQLCQHNSVITNKTDIYSDDNDNEIPLLLQFSINSITKQSKQRRKPGNYVCFVGQFLSTFLGTAFRDASREWRTFTAKEKATSDVKQLIDKVAVQGHYQRRVVSQTQEIPTTS